MAVSVENIRRFALTSPPCIIFSVSLMLMAIGILVLAFSLRFEPLNEANAESVTFCAFSHEPVGGKRKDLGVGSFKTSLLIEVRAAADLVENGTTNLHATGTITVGDLGILPWDPDTSVTSWFVSTQVNGARWSCHKDGLCSASACLQMYANTHPALPRTSPNTRCTAVSQIINETLAVRHMTLHGPQHHKIKCPRDAFITHFELDADTKYAVIGLQRDTVRARLHLLYTSCFLFFTLVVLLMYAACHRTQHTYNMTITKQTPNTRNAFS